MSLLSLPHYFCIPILELHIICILTLTFQLWPFVVMTVVTWNVVIRYTCGLAEVEFIGVHDSRVEYSAWLVKFTHDSHPELWNSPCCIPIYCIVDLPFVSVEQRWHAWNVFDISDCSETHRDIWHVTDTAELSVRVCCLFVRDSLVELCGLETVSMFAVSSL